MAWFKIDDSLHDHKKARRAGTAAMGLWALAGSWCASNLSDGFVPRDVALRYGTARQATKLVEVGLWVPAEHDGEAGWIFHDWNDYQPTRAEVQRKRHATAQRQAKTRAVRDQKTRSGDSVTRDERVTHSVNHASPDPTRPDIDTYVDRAGSCDVPREHSAATPPIVVEFPTNSPAPAPAPRPAEARVALGLVAEHVPPQPRKVADRLAGEAARLLAEGIPGEQVAAGLRLWSGKRVGPGLLAELVGEAMRTPAIQQATASRGGLATTDARVLAGLRLAEQLDVEDGRQPSSIAAPLRELLAGVAS
ncbi:hypothetical protein [Saccharopolyspora hattusasensis]|uniref:hypothetical protein n=1 Tax=Saccharopolyspora hattusasensis TaxID=1128679 RepID=UPI003D98CE7E